MKFTRSFSMGVLIIFIMMSSYALLAAPNAQTRYVAPGGADVGDCTNGSEPCQTIDYARQQTDPGDTIQLAAGTFTENVNLFTDLTIVGAGKNKTFVDGGQTGRVFSILGGPVRITDLTIQNGDAAGDLSGGGVTNNDHLTLDNVNIQHNHAPGSGGGVYNSGVMTVTHTTFYSNTANTSGAGLINFGTVTISESSVYENRLANFNGGGGLFNNGGQTMRLVNVTVSNNVAAEGGGIANGGDLELLNVTIAGNVSTNNFGSGLSNYGTADFQNTIVANNSGAAQCEGGGTFNSQGNNLENTNSCQFSQPSDLPSTSAKLRPLSFYGGPTPTQSLFPESPAIDAGDNGTCPATDQRGVSRPLDGDDVATVICDIGAVEFNPDTDGYRIFLPMIVR